MPQSCCKACDSSNFCFAVLLVYYLSPWQLLIWRSEMRLHVFRKIASEGSRDCIIFRRGVWNGPILPAGDRLMQPWIATLNSSNNNRIFFISLKWAKTHLIHLNCEPSSELFCTGPLRQPTPLSLLLKIGSACKTKDRTKRTRRTVFGGLALSELQLLCMMNFARYGILMQSRFIVRY